MNVTREIEKINSFELSRDLVGEGSWHEEYKDSAYIFFGGVSYDLTEGDLITIFSQYGEVVNIELIRDPRTGKSKGFGFLAYEDQRSTVLAVDNFNNTKLLGRTIRVDHVKNYENRKRERDDFDEEEEHKRLLKILPRRLQPKEWRIKAGESFEEVYKEISSSSSSEEDAKPEELEDPMMSYFKKREHRKKSKEHKHSKHHSHKTKPRHHHKSKQS